MAPIAKMCCTAAAETCILGVHALYSATCGNNCSKPHDNSKQTYAQIDLCYRKACNFARWGTILEGPSLQGADNTDEWQPAHVEWIHPAKPSSRTERNPCPARKERRLTSKTKFRKV